MHWLPLTVRIHSSPTPSTQTAPTLASIFAALRRHTNYTWMGRGRKGKFATSNWQVTATVWRWRGSRRREVFASVPLRTPATGDCQSEVLASVPVQTTATTDCQWGICFCTSINHSDNRLSVRYLLLYLYEPQRQQKTVSTVRVRNLLLYLYEPQRQQTIRVRYLLLYLYEPHQQQETVGVRYLFLYLYEPQQQETVRVGYLLLYLYEPHRQQETVRVRYLLLYHYEPERQENDEVRYIIIYFCASANQNDKRVCQSEVFDSICTSRIVV